MYASDNAGRYPPSLNLLLLQGKYLKTIPTCPVTKKDPYSGSYRFQQTPDCFSFYCQGNNHGRAYRGFSKDGTNFPQYHSNIGLIDRP
jgi:hypothetical protein